jgi:hypothetical protein
MKIYLLKIKEKIQKILIYLINNCIKNKK